MSHDGLPADDVRQQDELDSARSPGLEPRATGSARGIVLRVLRNASINSEPGQQLSLVRRILVSASATVFMQGTSLAMGFLTAVLLARFLGETGYGRYAFALAWAGLLSIPAILGLDRFLVRGIAVYEVEHKPSLMRGLLRRTNQLVLVTSVTVGALMCAVTFLWLPRGLRWPLCVAMLLVPLTNLTSLRQAAMQAIGRVVTGQFPEYLIRPFVIVGGIVVLKLVGGGLLTSTSALAVNVGGVAIAFTVGAIMLRRALPSVLQAVRPIYTTRDWVRAALPMMLISGIWAANNYVATLVVGSLAGTKAAGVYSVVEKGAELIVLLLVASNIPLAPVIARMHARKDRAGLQHATERVAQATFLCSAPLAILFAVFPKAYLSIFGFHAGGSALTILAIAQLVNAAAGPAGNVLLMTGHEKVAVRGIIAGLVANLILGIVLVPSLGVTGGAIASGSSLLLWNTILLLLARSRVGVNVTAFPWLAVKISDREHAR
jgi:O-antigen/teichoic acid export membrane protein